MVDEGFLSSANRVMISEKSLLFISLHRHTALGFFDKPQAADHFLTIDNSNSLNDCNSKYRHGSCSLRGWC